MATTERQNRLLVAEDWRKIYQAFQQADFTSYDFETLRRTMISYLRENYPDDFNDFVESSEYVALIDLIAYVAQALSFRVDLNARENFLETAERRNSVLRLATPEDGEIIVNDIIRGEEKFENNELDDLILLRSDGSPTYHLCNVVDDFEQGVSTVIRGEDHLSNTPRQIHIQNALGYPSLEYAHLPLVLGNDKKRLSKRHAATNLEEYRNLGYLDSAIINTLARLGWSKGEKEVFYIDDLVKDFSLSDVQKAGAIFDISKLDYLNIQHMAKLTLEDYINNLKPHLKNLNIDISSHPKAKKLIEAMRTSASTFSGVAKNLFCYFNEISEFDEKAIQKFVIGSENILLELKEEIARLDVWDEASIDSVLTEYREKNNLSVPKVNQPIRIALTGFTNSPSLGLTLSFFTQEESLKRIEQLIIKLYYLKELHYQ